MGYRYWTPEQKKRHEELQNERDQLSYEYECADEIVRAAMALFEKPDLRTLTNAMYFAHCRLTDEWGDMSDEELKDFGLDVWLAEQEKTEAMEEQERLDQEEEEREQQEEEEEQERLEQEEEERLEAASRGGGSESA